MGGRLWPDHTPDEAGLGWAVKIKKSTDSKGREAVESQRANGISKRLGLFATDKDVALWRRELVYRNNIPVGWLISAGFGHTVGKFIDMGYIQNKDGIDSKYILDGSYELEVQSERVPCTVQLGGFYDPEMKRVKS